MGPKPPVVKPVPYVKLDWLIADGGVGPEHAFPPKPGPVIVTSIKGVQANCTMKYAWPSMVLQTTSNEVISIPQLEDDDNFVMLTEL